ncbi:MAG: hypothetical protein ABJD75_01180 [Parasphingorhabdus sp.]|uniref:hypothetical protein n=1 Tax=Parasphingorhabdus sp. TaxID=2709688 RepID=UPI003264D62B
MKFLILWASLASISVAIQVAMNRDFHIADILFIPGSILVVPVNPQGGNQYFLSRKPKESG